MRRRTYGRNTVLTLTAGALVLLGGGDLSAQTPRPGEGSIVIGETSIGEIAPTLLQDPDGKVFRLWQRSADLADGGSGLLLAEASAEHAWKTVLEILPREKGISVLAPWVAFGTSGRIVVAYQWRQDQPRSKEIRLARSNDGGKTWIHSDTRLDRAGTAFGPKVAWGNGQDLVVVWEDERRAVQAWDIYARRSSDGGATWEPEQLLSRFPHQIIRDLNARPQLVSDGQNRFWVVWVGLRNGRSRLYLSRSVDAGKTWGEPVELSGGDSQSVGFGRGLFRAGDRLLVVWQDRRSGRSRIYAVSSSDGGTTWTPPTRVDHLPADMATDAIGPSVVLKANGEVFIAWHDGRNGRFDVFICRSTDGGRTWDKEDTRLDADDPGTSISQFANLAVAPDGRLAVAWEDDRAGFEGIYARIRGTGDQPAWGPEILVAPPGPRKGARVPRVLWAKDQSLYVWWEVWDYTLGPLAVTKQIDGRILTPDKK